MSRESVDFVADAGGGNRTHTLLRELDFESSASNHETIENEGFSLRTDLPVENVQKIDPDLQVLMTAWPTLPDALRQGILAMVKAVNP